MILRGEAGNIFGKGGVVAVHRVIHVLKKLLFSPSIKKTTPFGVVFFNISDRYLGCLRTVACIRLV